MRVMLFCTVFAVSLIIPIVVSLTNLPLFGFIGYIDALLAIILLVLSIIFHINRPNKRKKGSRRIIANIYKALLTVPVILAGLFLLGLRLKWDVLLLGLAWRFWLLASVLDDLVQTYKKTNSRNLPQEYK